LTRLKVKLYGMRRHNSINKNIVLYIHVHFFLKEYTLHYI